VWFTDAFASIWNDITMIKAKDWCLYRDPNSGIGTLIGKMLPINCGDMVIVTTVNDNEFQWDTTLEDIDHAKTRIWSPQSNGICERFHKTILNEFYQVAFRKKLYRSIEELQTDVDQGIEYYNKQRHHSGKYGFVKTPRQTFLDSIQLAKGKVINQKFPVINSTDGQTSS
jgi:hypothetical protein